MFGFGNISQQLQRGVEQRVEIERAADLGRDLVGRRQTILLVLKLAGTLSDALLKRNIQPAHLNIEPRIRERDGGLTDHGLGEILLQTQLVERVRVLKHHDGQRLFTTDHRQRQHPTARLKPSTLAAHIRLELKLERLGGEGPGHDVALALKRDQHPNHRHVLCADRM